MAGRLMELKVVSLGRVYGPVPIETLVRLAGGGRISTQDLVRPVGAPTWLRVTEVPSLAACLPQPSVAGKDLEMDLDAGTKWVAPKPRRRAEEAEMDMTPMIDVTFQLLIFFMLTHAMANPPPMDVPEAKHGRGVNMEGQQLILVDQDGKYYLGHQAEPENAAESLDVLVKEVRSNASQTDAKMDVIINAHKKARHANVRDLVERLGPVPNLGRVMLGIQEKMH